MMFLPISVLIYWISPKRLRDLVLVLCGGIFFMWGEWNRFWILPAVIGLSYIFGLGIGKTENARVRKIIFVMGVLTDLLILVWFKYGNMLNRYYYPRQIDPSVMPTGLSFLIFMAISYLADIYNGKAKVQTDPVKTALYLSFFPRISSGPIDLYRNAEEDLSEKRITFDDIAYGCKRFVIGLGKKVILADYFGLICSRIYSVRISYLPYSVLWLGLILYTLEIYYDFSGYSDMAAGLGRIFGFHLSENFNYPYTAGSISDFWRRWHISLSAWFREYVYIPLGGNRRGKFVTAVNLLTVFLLTGIWHGSGPTFLLFGLWHGLCVVLDRFLTNRLPAVLKRILTIVQILVGWVLFRSSSVQEAMTYLGRILTFGEGYPAYRLGQFCDIKTVAFMAAGILGCGLIQHLVPSVRKKIESEQELGWVQAAVLLLIFLVSLAKIIAGTYNAFIYFQF